MLLLLNVYIYQGIKINLLQKREMNGIRIVNMKKSAHQYCPFGDKGYNYHGITKGRKPMTL